MLHVAPGVGAGLAMKDLQIIPVAGGAVYKKVHNPKQVHGQQDCVELQIASFLVVRLCKEGRLEAQVEELQEMEAAREYLPVLTRTTVRIREGPGTTRPTKPQPRPFPKPLHLRDLRTQNHRAPSAVPALNLQTRTLRKNSHVRGRWRRFSRGPGEILQEAADSPPPGRHNLGLPGACKDFWKDRHALHPRHRGDGLLPSLGVFLAALGAFRVRTP